MDIRSLQSLQQIFQSPAVGEAKGAPVPQAGSSTASPTALASDETSMSRAGSLINQALQLTDVRAEKIAGIQQALAANTYHVSSEAVAETLMQHMLAN